MLNQTLKDTSYFYKQYLALYSVHMLKVKDWCELAGKARKVRVACLMLVVLDNLVCMVTNSKQRLEVCLLQTKLVDDLQRAEVYLFYTK